MSQAERSDPTTLRDELRVYCRRDGEALLEVHRALRALAAAEGVAKPETGPDLT